MINNKHGILEMTEMNYDKNRPKTANPIKIQDVTFRDGHQSIFATRGRTEDMLDVASQMDEIGFHSMEVWGGATFDTMHRYLNEDPWERITTLKKYLKKTPLSMLLRGQNLVGYRNYSDDVVEAFVDTACNRGIDIFRVFDALNDFRNFETAVKIIKQNEKHFQGTICYSLTEKRMGGDIYNLDYYLKKAKELVEMGADSICIKDMAGLISPYDAYNLIVALKENYDKPIHLHTHFTSGMGDLTLMKAVEAGVDIIDTCMSPYAYRTSHPAVEPFVISLLGTNRDTGFDIEALAKIDEKLEKSATKYMDYLDKTKLSVIDINVILHQTPGGMLSNLVNQLKMMNSLDKLPKVFETLPKVRKDLGSVPLVTPTSQIVGIQTVNNVLFDTKEESYTKITEQVKDLCFGLYGHTTRPINPDVQKKALSGYPRGEEPITSRPGDIIEPELPEVEKKFGDLAKTKEDLLICALYPVTGKRFLKWKYGQQEIPNEVKPKTYEDVEKEKKLIEDLFLGKLEVIPKKEAPEKPDNLKNYKVYVDGEYFNVEIAEDGVPNVVTQPNPAPRAKKSAPKVKKTAPTIQDGDNPIIAPIPGMISEYKKVVGDEVEAGETIVVLEAMKMLNNLDAPCDGVIKTINFSEGDSVAQNDVLCVIEKK
jgi:pyruvate/oxaloacetate carboxyltransferase/biotin carboxyl carrier protein